MSDFVRTQGGMILHRADCRYAGSKSAIPWLWAKGRHADTVAYAVLVVGIHACKFCDPLVESLPGLPYADRAALHQVGGAE
jgi:hypothetical protein